jgi:murein DD-endopeptidase MepM/ murein hydrolase activator NlpD
MKGLQMPFRSVAVSVFLGILTSLSGPAAASGGHEGQKIEMTPRKIHQGDVVLVKVFPSSSFQEIRGLWRGKRLIFRRDETGGAFQSLLGIDLDQPPGEEVLQLTLTDGAGAGLRRDVRFQVLEKAFPIQRLTLPSRMVTLSPEDLARVKREGAVVMALFDAPLREGLWGRGFILPVEGALLSPFGVRRVINNEPRSPHTGVDLKASAGEPVHASNDGIVVFTGDHFFSGKSVFLDHGMGIVTMYFHLSCIEVKEGQRVARGQVIGKVGSSGRATGPHLHWGVRIQGSRVDPLSLVGLYQD